MKSTAAFTLVEICVCLIVIAILAVLLIKAGETVLDSSRQVKCLANMRLLTTGVGTYSAEHNGDLLPWLVNYSSTGQPANGTTWITTLMAEGIVTPDLRSRSTAIGTPLDCPVRRQLPFKPCIPNKAQIHYGYTTYPGFDSQFDVVGTAKTHKTLEIQTPGKTLCLSEANGSYLIVPWTDTYRIFPHRGGMNVTYFDGHAEWKSQEAMPLIKVRATTNAEPYY